MCNISKAIAELLADEQIIMHEVERQTGVPANLQLTVGCVEHGPANVPNANITDDDRNAMLATVAAFKASLSCK